jgi:hypothetical protein
MVRGFVLLSTALLSLGTSPAAVAQSIPLLMTCRDLKGTILPAPEWKAEPDGLTDQEVRVLFGGDLQPSKVEWSRNGNTYSESTGIGKSMKSGFVIVVFADDYVETYVYNAGTTDILFQQTRSGSSLFQNAMKSFQGRCKIG